jgi:hypothetical protein
MQDATDDPPVIHSILAAHVCWKQRFDLLPLLVAQPK